MDNILVTGASGFIGGSISIRLKELGYSVFGVDLISKKYLSKYFDSFICGDYVDIIKPDFANHKFSHIVHCAGTSLVHPSFKYPLEYYQNNVGKTTDLLYWITRYSPQTKIIFSSSASVYKDKEEPLSEDSELQPLSPYAKSKKMVEDIILDANNSYGLKYTIFRYFNACGSIGKEHGQQPNATHIFPRLFESKINNSLFSLYGDSIRDYVHVDDLVDAHVKIIENDAIGIYNLGNRHGYKSSDIVRRFIDKVGDVEIAVEPKRKGEPDKLIANIEKAKSEIDWTPTKTLDDVIDDLKKWYNSNNYKELLSNV